MAVQSETRPSNETTITSSTKVDEEREKYESTDEETHLDVGDSDYPDGGLRAWLVVFGTMCGTFSTFGYATSWGVFQAYYERTILRHSSPSDIAWIGSIQFSLILLPGLVTGRLFDIGYFKLPLFCASVVLILSTFLVAECTEYWHFLLCQGLATGLSAGTIFGPTMGIIGHWFHKRRGLALGLCAVGSAIGGTVLPVAAHNLIIHVGFKWTMRILGFILLLTIGCTNLLLERRLPPVNVKGGLLNLHAFKSPVYSVYCLSAFFAFLGMYTLPTFINISSITIGINPNVAFYLVAIANGSSGFARCLAGWLTDRVGAINVMIPVSTFGALLTFIWPYVHTEAGVIIIAALYGQSVGTYVSCFFTPLFHMGGIGDVGRRTGMIMSIGALGALAGTPISGAINKATGGFDAVGYYAGGMSICAVLLMIITRHLVLGRLRGKF